MVKFEKQNITKKKIIIDIAFDSAKIKVKTSYISDKIYLH